jgi:NAD(P)H-hydrate repair Nnr-like enzyme with NAD(P)H-hydrate dehydratase domain
MQQMRAFPWDEAPRYVLRDRDAIYGREFAAMTRDMGMGEVLTAHKGSPLSQGLKEFLDAAVIPALVKEYLSERECESRLAPVPEDVAQSIATHLASAEGVQ